MKLVGLFYILFFSLNGLAQAGYLGLRNGFEMKVDFNPSLKRVAVVKDNLVVTRPRFACTKTSFSLSRVVTRHVEISLAYEFTRIIADLDGLFYDSSDSTFTYDIGANGYASSNYSLNGDWAIDNPRFNHHGFNFEYHYFRKRNLAPLGNYVGFAINAGYCKIEKGSHVTYGDVGTLQSTGVFRDVYEIASSNLVTLDKTESFSTMHFSVNAGQNIPLSKRIIFSAEISIPFVYAVFFEDDYSVVTNFGYYNFGQFANSMANIKHEDVMAYSFGLYNRLSANFGLRVMF